MLDIASDTCDIEFPIFRIPSMSDGAMTVATAVFDLNEKTMSVYVCKPSITYKPLFKLQME